MPDKDTIMRAVREGLDSLELTTSDGNPAWTKAIATKLCKIGRSFDFKVGAETVDKENCDSGEWLYDVIWRKHDEADRILAVPLVAECEWKNPKEILKDFNKLLVARACVRLMIYDGNYGAGSKWIAEQLATRVRKFKISTGEDSWLLAAWEKCGPPAKESGEKDWRFRYYKIGMNAILWE